MNPFTLSQVETYYSKKDDTSLHNQKYRKIPVIVVDHYVELGKLTALRFLEWVCRNPGGVVALPTGKTPEFFIKWTEYFLKNWERETADGLLATLGFTAEEKPDIRSLHLFQLDEFFPIDPHHERSFRYFISKYYVENFGFDRKKVHLIDTNDLENTGLKLTKPGLSVYDVFPDGKIDLGLRFRQATTEAEQLRQKVIRVFDSFCSDYEEKIRKLGGLGFFLGGIGPDGHIAFNIKGSSHFSHTRLTNLNYETQAAAAVDLGGIEWVKKKAVITLGLESITYNPEVTAIIIAAGETKSGVVRDAVENPPSLEFPASSLQKLPNARFYITRSASVRLNRSEAAIKKEYQSQLFPERLVENLVIKAACKNNCSLMELERLSETGKTATKELKLALSLSRLAADKLISKTYASLTEKIERGLKVPENEKILHTAPHHDDIELAYFPYIHHLVRSKFNENYFCYCTSGFTSVTNQYVAGCLEKCIYLLSSGQSHFHENLLSSLSQSDEQLEVTEYLQAIALQNKELQEEWVAFRLIRKLLQEYPPHFTLESLIQQTTEYRSLVSTLIPGMKNPDIIQKIKGWLREFEAEVAWAHFGIPAHHVSHLRMKFYTEDIFPEYPDYEEDVLPVLKMLETIKPGIITLAMDPEGSGPDTHYKVLIALAEAIDIYAKKHRPANLRIWGYRNIWTRFDPSAINIIVPVSLNSFAVLHNMFNTSFLSQKSASFPSPEMDATFSQLAQKIWVEQQNLLVDLLGRDYFYHSPNPLLRRTYGAIFLKEMNLHEFRQETRGLKELLKTRDQLKS